MAEVEERGTDPDANDNDNCCGGCDVRIHISSGAPFPAGMARRAQSRRRLRCHAWHISSGFMQLRCTLIQGTRSMPGRAELSIAATFRTGPFRQVAGPVMASAGEETSLTLLGDTSAAEFNVSRFEWHSSTPRQIDDVGLRFANEATHGITIRSGEASETFPARIAESQAIGEIRRCSSASISASVFAAGMTQPQLMPAWGMADEGCRGGHPPENAADCDKRAVFDERLRQLGWCYGRPNDLGYQMRWRRCEAR